VKSGPYLAVKASNPLTAPRSSSGSAFSRVCTTRYWCIAANGSCISLLTNNTTPAKALGISGSSQADGGKAIQWTHQPSNPDQQWIREANGDKFRLINVNSQQCLAIPHGAPEHNIQAIQWTCDRATTAGGGTAGSGTDVGRQCR
jgi:hypothetical protein